jgi:hypothetical protein
VSTSEDIAVAYYISSHGYGHGVRSCDIIRAVNNLYPPLKIHVISELPPKFLRNRIGSDRNPIRPQSFDVGMVQLDSIRVDLNATLNKVETLLSRREELVSQEADYLKKMEIRLVVVDIPGIPLESAARTGIPKLAVGNFGWDWIYSGFAAQDRRWSAAVEVFREQYSRTDLLLRLPFCEEMEAFTQAEDLPLVASPGKTRRSAIAAFTGSDPRKKWILLSFTTLDWDEEALARVERIETCEFFTVKPLAWVRNNIHPLDRDQVTFSDAVASVDAVISKPGFGILSDCIVNQKPLIYADRSHFLEYPILESAIRKHLKHIHIPSAQLYRGDLVQSLESIWESSEPEEKLPRGGDVLAARRIARFAGLER